MVWHEPIDDVARVPEGRDVRIEGRVLVLVESQVDTGEHESMRRMMRDDLKERTGESESEERTRMVKKGASAFGVARLVRGATDFIWRPYCRIFSIPVLGRSGTVVLVRLMGRGGGRAVGGPPVVGIEAGGAKGEGPPLDRDGGGGGRGSAMGVTSLAGGLEPEAMGRTVWDMVGGGRGVNCGKVGVG